MEQKEKELLLRYLFMAAPYGVAVNYKEDKYDYHRWKITHLYVPSYSKTGILIDTYNDGWIGFTEYVGCGMSSGERPFHLDKHLPYLRPMSSMTEEERKEVGNLIKENRPNPYGIINNKGVDNLLFSVSTTSSFLIGWLLKNHFDFMGLIPKGLAIAVTKENNPYTE